MRAEPEVFLPVSPPAIALPEDDRLRNDPPSVDIPAFKEQSYIRLAYLHAVMSNVYGNCTWERATQQLNGALDVLLAAGQLPMQPTPVRTLASARRRLGIDPDAWIIEYAICPVCWKHHSPLELQARPTGARIKGYLLPILGPPRKYGRR